MVNVLKFILVNISLKYFLFYFAWLYNKISWKQMVEFLLSFECCPYCYIGVNGSSVSLQDLMRMLATRKGLNYKKYLISWLAGFEKTRFNSIFFFFFFPSPCNGIKMIVTINLHESGNELSKNEPITNIYISLKLWTYLTCI